METAFITTHNLEESVQDQSVLALVPTGARFVSIETSAPGPDDVYPEWYNNWLINWEVSDGYDPETIGRCIADYYALSFGEAPDYEQWTNIGQVYKNDGLNYVLTDVFVSPIGTGAWAVQANHGLG